MSESIAPMIVPGIRYTALEARYDQRNEGTGNWLNRQPKPKPKPKHRVRSLTINETRLLRAAKIRADIADYVRQHHGCTAFDAAHGISHHYSCNAKAAYQFKAWLREGRVEGVFCQRVGTENRLYPVGYEGS